MRRSLLALLPFGALAALAANPAPADLLLVWPLDTAVVSIDSSVSTAVLTTGKAARRAAPSPALLVAREFHPRFGAAIAHAARRVEVVDSSAANPDPLRVFENVRLKPAGGDSVTFSLPVVPDADSARYALVLGALSFSRMTKTVARRFVEPSPPKFDPATGEMTPGRHKGYSEGPGRMTTLAARASWVVWDRDAGVALAVGTATGSASFRGEARRPDWDEAARELAKDLLRQTPFTPFR